MVTSTQINACTDTEALTYAAMYACGDVATPSGMHWGYGPESVALSIAYTDWDIRYLRSLLLYLLYGDAPNYRPYCGYSDGRMFTFMTNRMAAYMSLSRDTDETDLSLMRRALCAKLAGEA